MCRVKSPRLATVEALSQVMRVLEVEVADLRALDADTGSNRKRRAHQPFSGVRGSGEGSAEVPSAVPVRMGAQAQSRIAPAAPARILLVRCGCPSRFGQDCANRDRKKPVPKHQEAAPTRRTAFRR